MEPESEDTELVRVDISVLNIATTLELVDVNADTDTLIELESDENEVLRLFVSSTSAIEYCTVVICVVSASMEYDCDNDDIASFRVLVSVNIAVDNVESVVENVADCNGTMESRAETRLLVSVERFVLNVLSVALSDDTEVLINEESEETATLRVLISLERVVLNPVSTTAREDTFTLSVLAWVERLTVRVLVSAESKLRRVESTTDKEDADVLNNVDNDETEPLRVLVSVEIAVLRVESTTLREDADVLNALDKAETVLLRTEVSVESAVEREMCELKILVAKAASGPISFFKLANVSTDEVKLLIASIVEVKKDSVANTFELYWG